MATPDVLTLHAERIPERIALIDHPAGGPVTTRTFRELNADVNRLANLLQGRGLRTGDKLVWCGKNSFGVVRMMHAARKIGATAVPLNYRLTPGELSYIVAHCDAHLAYVDAELAPLFAELRNELPALQDILVFDGPAPGGTTGCDDLFERSSDREPEVGGSDRFATMFYTSGTTGKPKGALRVGPGDRSQSNAFVELVGYEPDDIFITTGPLYHSGPGGFTHLAHRLGHTVVLQRKFDPEDWLRLVQEHRVTSTFAAPTPIRMICNLPAETKDRYDRSSMRRMVANAAPWSMALKRAYLADFPDDSLWEVYGSTELGLNTVLRPEDQLRKPGSCGKPVPGIEIVLFDEAGEPISEPGKPGELYATGPSIFNTYYKAEDRFEKDRRGDYQTVGDIAYFDDEGYYYICDRKADMIISGGVNVYPAEIEAALERHPQIMDVAVFGIPDEQWGESVHAVVVPRAGQTLSASDVQSFAREQLAGFKVPRSVSFLDEIPRTGSGKTLKRVLREPYWKDRTSAV